MEDRTGRSRHTDAHTAAWWGVAVVMRGQMWGLSAQGRLLWEQEADLRPYDWALTDERLIFTIEGRDGPVWSIGPAGPVAWQAPIGGRLVVADDQLFVYAADGVYRLHAETLSGERLYALPRGAPDAGDMVALPDGGLLVVHRDPFDRRLIALNGDGTLRWQRSYYDVLGGRQRLLMLGAHPLLLSENGASAASDELAVWVIDLDGASLARIFTAGSREFVPGPASALVIDDDRILVSFDERLVMLDVGLALQAVSEATSSQ